MTQFRQMASLVLALFAFLVLPFSVQGEPLPQEKSALLLREFTVQTLSSQDIRVDSGLALENSRLIRSLLRDGAILNLSCKLVVERVRSVLTNDTLAERTELYQLRHDPLTREFIMIHEGSPVLRNKKLDQMLSSFLPSLSFDLPLLEPLISGENYRVRLDATLQHAEVPPWLEKALFFWSWDVAPPASFTQDFIY